MMGIANHFYFDNFLQTTEIGALRLTICECELSMTDTGSADVRNMANRNYI
jgi:hypothetical protein